MKKNFTFLLFWTVLIFPLQMGLSAPADKCLEDDLLEILDNEITWINENISDIRMEVLEIKKILTGLTKREAPQLVIVNTDDESFVGNKNAPVTLVEFSDYQCSFCSLFAKDVLPRLKTEYINTGRLKYIFRDFPSDTLKIAEAVHCAGDQGKYWEMHETIFENQQEVNIPNLKDYAKNNDLDMKVFNSCLDSGKHTGEIRKDIEAGNKIGLEGTPTFILGQTTPDGIMKGRLIMGAVQYDVFKSMIDAILKNK